MDLEFINRPWTFEKLHSLVHGIALIDDEAGDGARDAELVSYYQLKCHAYDMGRPEAVLDCLDLERAVNDLDDLQVRAAISLKLWGWEDTEIGAAIGGRRTGSQLVRTAISHLNSQSILRAVEEELGHG